MWRISIERNLLLLLLIRFARTELPFNCCIWVSSSSMPSNRQNHPSRRVFFLYLSSSPVSLSCHHCATIVFSITYNPNVYHQFKNELNECSATTTNVDDITSIFFPFISQFHNLVICVSFPPKSNAAEETCALAHSHTLALSRTQARKKNEGEKEETTATQRIDLIHRLLLLPFLSSSAPKCLFFMVQISIFSSLFIFFFRKKKTTEEKNEEKRRTSTCMLVYSVCSLVPVLLLTFFFFTSSSKLIIG